MACNATSPLQSGRSALLGIFPASLLWTAACGCRRIEPRGGVLVLVALEVNRSELLVVRSGRLGPYMGVAHGGGAVRASGSEQNGPVSSLDGFEAFVAAHERRLRQALTAVFGIDRGREMAADAFVYAWEHWDRVAGMVNPAGYLFVVGRNQHRRRFRNRLTKPVFDVGPATDNRGASPGWRCCWRGSRIESGSRWC